MKGTNVTHLPEALSEEFKKALKQDALQGCPLIDSGNQDENGRYFLFIFFMENLGVRLAIMQFTPIKVESNGCLELSVLDNQPSE